VIRLIDDFGVHHSYMMNVGARKGKIVSELIAEHKPSTMIELGSYIGYSTVLFAAALREAGGNEYISFEREPKFANVAKEMVKLAGLEDVVRFVVGSSSSGLVKECKEGRLDRVDMVFLDHYKPAYVKDLKILESLGAIQKGTVLAADNVIAPGNPTYLAYVRATPEEKQKAGKKSGKGLDVNGFPTKTVDQYKKEYAADDVELPGVPAIVYESRIVHSHEPTGVPDGVEITICKSVPENI
jgi:catechol O-methyltransferase